MIRVRKPTPGPTVLQDRGAKEAEQLCAAFDAAPNDYLSGKRRHQFKSSIYAHKSVKDALLAAQHHKCAFCESVVSHIAHGDVEHFRPKAGYQQSAGGRLTRPGYYWLAYSWGNLFFVCQLCNQQRKGNLFPLRRPTNRARSHADDVAAEESLLIDPSAVEPAEFIRFREQYALPVRNRREGKTTIDVLGLNREKLAEVRAEKLSHLKALHNLCEFLRQEMARRPSMELSDRLRRHEDELRSHGDDRSPYAAMARAFLAQIGLI